MSQDWIPNTSGELDSDNLISDSRSYINDALEALRTCFSGTSAPTSPAAIDGMQYAKTDTNDLQMYDGATWRKILEYDRTWGGLLPRDDGVTYGMASNIAMNSHKITGLSDGSASTDSVSLGQADARYLNLTGGTMSGDITCGANDITMDHNPDASTKLARKAYVDLFLPLAGSTMTGSLDMGSQQLTGLTTPSVGSDAATKTYVDNEFDTSTGHDHDGTDSKKVLWTNLLTTGASANQIMVSDGAGGTSVVTEPSRRAWTDNDNSSTAAGSTSYVSVASETITGLGKSALVEVHYVLKLTSGSSGNIYGRIQVGGATEFEEVEGPGGTSTVYEGVIRANTESGSLTIDYSHKTSSVDGANTEYYGFYANVLE